VFTYQTKSKTPQALQLQYNERPLNKKTQFYKCRPPAKRLFAAPRKAAICRPPQGGYLVGVFLWEPGKSRNTNNYKHPSE